MMEQNAQVVATQPGYAWVEVARRAACGGCQTHDNCGVSQLGQLVRQAPTGFCLTDPLGLKPGDQVMLGIADSLLTRVSLVVYLLPVLGLLAAALTAAAWQLPEGGQALAGLGGLALGLGAVRWWGRSPRAAQQPQILYRISPSQRVAFFNTKEAPHG